MGLFARLVGLCIGILSLFGIYTILKFLEKVLFKPISQITLLEIFGAIISIPALFLIIIIFVASILYTLTGES